MNNKRPYGKAFATTVQRKPFRSFPQNTTVNTTPMVLYRTPSQFKSLTNPPQGRIWPEKKNTDRSASLGNVGSAAWSELDCLNGITQGISANERVGRKIQMKSLQVRWSESTTASLSALRILVVYDRDGLPLPFITDVLSVDNFNSNMQLSNSDRFVVLHDEVIPCEVSGPTNNRRAGKFYIKLNLPTMYQGTTNAGGDISHGSLWIMSNSLNGPIGAGIGYNSRVRYTDV